MSGFQDKVSFIWSIADLLRGDYKQSEYRKVILPFTVLRRCGSLPPDSSDLLRHLKTLPAELREILDCFQFRDTIARLQKAGLLELILERFARIDLDPASVSNHEMGYIFEELIRKFSEQSNETAGEHFTPREVVQLMVRLVFQDDYGAGKSFYDPACGTGGMLAAAEESAREPLEIAGQELNPESYAICKADALMRGHPASSIALGQGRDFFARQDRLAVDQNNVAPHAQRRHGFCQFDGFGECRPRGHQRRRSHNAASMRFDNGAIDA